MQPCPGADHRVEELGVGRQAEDVDLPVRDLTVDPDAGFGARSVVDDRLIEWQPGVPCDRDRLP